MHASEWVKIAMAVTGIYLFFVGGVMQVFPNLGRKEKA
jgi:phosphatidylcholine synthase